jgi:hypothetical protein
MAARIIIPIHKLPPAGLEPRAGIPMPVQPSRVPMIGAGVTAKLMSLDAGIALYMSSAFYAQPPSKSDRHGSARWNEAGVAQASPQPLEYQCTNPSERTYYCFFEAYTHVGLGGDVEDYLSILEELKNRVPGKKRAHKLLWVQGKQRFKCVLFDYNANITHVSLQGGAMIVPDVAIHLVQIV